MEVHGRDQPTRVSGGTFDVVKQVFGLELHVSPVQAEQLGCRSAVEDVPAVAQTPGDSGYGSLNPPLCRELGYYPGEDTAVQSPRQQDVYLITTRARTSNFFAEERLQSSGNLCRRCTGSAVWWYWQ
jgi:hypothetical protein